MAGSTRAELASSGLEGTAFASAYPNGSRGTYSSSSLERSGSFRESLENRMLIPGSVISRNAPQTVETPPLSQYLTLDLFSTSELKCVRSGELRRVLGISVEDQSFGSSQSKALPPISWEELKRFKGCVQETHNKARERAKLCQEQILKLDKYRNIVSKKRQRNEIQASEKSGVSNLLKIGSQLHQNSSDLLSQRPEERTKNLVPNKRVRSSMVEVRSEGRSTVPARQGATIEKDKMIILDKDKNMLRACNGGTTASEDKMRGLPAGGDGWEKKLKRKRSVGTMVARTTDGDRELKQVIQQRPNTEPRPRSCDGLGFRTGSSNSIIGNSKLDGSSQLLATGSRIMPRGDLDNGCLSSERRERSVGPDKERFVAKGNSKLNIREDALAGNQSPVAKGKASRAPRTGLGAAMNTHNFSRSSGGVDGWEQPPSLNKVQPLAGAVNRKRPLPTGSSSAVAQWVGQRPQKISRTRRANVISPVSNFDESQALPEGFAAPDAGASRLTSLELSGILPSRGTPNNSHQIKMKLENVSSPAGLSESEESAATENKSKEKGIDNGEVEDVILNAANRAQTFVLPTKKNKLPLKEEIGDGVRRQGRSGRGMVQPKAGLPVMKEKLENIDSTKPLKGGRSTSDKTESRVGRPPSKKVSDRKAYTRHGQITSSELTGESDDDREELLAAANAARTASYTASSSPFWKKMEPLFAFVGSEELNFVKHQICFAEELDESLSKLHDADQNSMGELMFQSAQSSQTSFSVEQQVSQTNVVRLKMSGGTMHSVDEPQACGKVETERWFDKIIPLSQRLLSAFISEDGVDGLDCSTEQMDALLQFSSDFSPYGADSHVENEHEADLVKSEFVMDTDLKSQKNKSGDNLRCNGSAISSCFRSPDIVMHGDELLQENDDVVLPDTGTVAELRQANPNEPQAASTGFSETTYECSFEHISLDDRILMELHSIGIYPEIVPDLAEGEDEEINKVLSELKILLYDQVRKKKSHLCQLERAIEEGKKYEERNLEHLAMNKLVEMAYKRLLGGRGSHGSSHKSGVSKVSKQLALAFGKRTLARCQKFEEGQSCFSEPVLRNVLSAPLNNDAKFVDGISSGISHKVNVESHSSQFGSRLSASGAVISGITTNMVERHGLNLKLDIPFQAAAHMPDQAFVKNDPISNRGKKREALLDDVVTGAALRVTSTPSHTLLGNTKWKRTDKDKDQNKDSLTRNSAAKAGRPSSSTGRGERKTKAKPKQKIAQLSTSGNGLGRVTETTHFVLPMQESFEIVNSGSTNVLQEVGLPRSANITEDLSKELDDTIFTNLPLQGIDSIDELDVADGLGGQGQDIGSWLNVVDEDVLQDNDLVGLEIPMDDLSELTLNF